MLPTLVSVVAAAFAMPLVVAWGLSRLPELEAPAATWRWLAGPPAGAIAGVAAGLAAMVAGSNWWLPGLACWAVALTGSALCDAATQRVPTRLIEVGVVTSGCLIGLAVVATRSWRAGLVTIAATAVSSLVVSILWRFAGAGFGDVRLAALGGLGLGNASISRIALGLVAFCAVTLLQALWTFSRTRNRRAMIAYGPGLAVLFLVAAAA